MKEAGEDPGPDVRPVADGGCGAGVDDQPGVHGQGHREVAGRSAPDELAEVDGRPPRHLARHVAAGGGEGAELHVRVPVDQAERGDPAVGEGPDQALAGVLREVGQGSEDGGLGPFQLGGGDRGVLSHAHRPEPEVPGCGLDGRGHRLARLEIGPGHKEKRGLEGHQSAEHLEVALVPARDEKPGEVLLRRAVRLGVVETKEVPALNVGAHHGLREVRHRSARGDQGADGEDQVDLGIVQRRLQGRFGAVRLPPGVELRRAHEADRGSGHQPDELALDEGGGVPGRGGAVANDGNRHRRTRCRLGGLARGSRGGRGDRDQSQGGEDQGSSHPSCLLDGRGHAPLSGRTVVNVPSKRFTSKAVSWPSATGSGAEHDTSRLAAARLKATFKGFSWHAPRPLWPCE
jgi:hypothetical protein